MGTGSDYVESARTLSLFSTERNNDRRNKILLEICATLSLFSTSQNKDEFCSIGCIAPTKTTGGYWSIEGLYPAIPNSRYP